MDQQLAAINANIHQLLGRLKQEGLLDDQFWQLMALQDEGNPDFVQEVVELYFEDSASKLDKLGAKLATDAVNFNEVDGLVHQFKGSSASFGAQTIAALCVHLRETCQQQNPAGCRVYLGQIKEAFTALKGQLEVFMQLETQRKQLTASSNPGAA